MAVPGIADYAAFLPSHWQQRVEVTPESTRWHWRGHDVHVLRRGNQEAVARVILVHGAGGHSAALWPIASLLPANQVELAAVDLGRV